MRRREDDRRPADVMAALPHELRFRPVTGCGCVGCDAVAVDPYDRLRRQERDWWCELHGVDPLELLRASARETLWGAR